MDFSVNRVFRSYRYVSGLCERRSLTVSYRWHCSGGWGRRSCQTGEKETAERERGQHRGARREFGEYG